MLSPLYGPIVTSIHDYWKNHSFDYTDLCQQSNVSTFSYTVKVCHSFSSKEQASFNFMAAVTICSDFQRESESHSVVPDSFLPHGLQPARILCPQNSPGQKLKWVAVPFSRESSQPRDQTQISHIAGEFFTVWATRKAQFQQRFWRPRK